jgi:hypothetical protein
MAEPSGKKNIGSSTTQPHRAFLVAGRFPCLDADALGLETESQPVPLSYPVARGGADDQRGRLLGDELVEAGRVACREPVVEAQHRVSNLGRLLHVAPLVARSKATSLASGRRQAALRNEERILTPHGTSRGCPG